MMTKVSVISTFTTIQGSGKVEFECDIDKTTVGGVKERVEDLALVAVENQSLWWRGYILDEDGLSILHACRGVNDGEAYDAGTESLILYVTVPIEKRLPPSPLLEFRKPRMPSFDFASSLLRDDTDQRSWI
jgi:hypothetical protein